MFPLLVPTSRKTSEKWGTPSSKERRIRVKTIILIAVILGSAQVGSTQAMPTIEQCRTTANHLIALSSAELAKFQNQMTAGDELVYSTQLAKCLEQYPTVLSQPQSDKLERIVYHFDADVIRRMLDFMQRHRLADKFNDEEEARKSK
ncbi:MAG: hypothetical protein JWN74_2003 [Acidobacteriaceae bacterium]|nr:hypothetical protein [Acidobacteriaceae bacterium]